MRNFMYWSSLLVAIMLIVSCGKNEINDSTVLKKSFTISGVTFEMIFVEGGTFSMGATAEQWYPGGDDNPKNDYENELPVHMVTLSDYAIGMTEVTQELWNVVMHSNPSDYKGEQLPVETISYNDCLMFIDRLNEITLSSRPSEMVFRLPTEAEWEYAARGGNKSEHYRFSGSNNPDEVAWYSGNCKKPNKVAKLKPNELGIYDMSGNVYEWCYDNFSQYNSHPQVNPVYTSKGGSKVVRGGGNFRTGISGVSDRHSYGYTMKTSSVGFRLVLGNPICN